MIDVKDIRGNIRCSIEVSERCIYHKELMGEEYVLLTFNSKDPVGFQKGDYIETEFGRFEIVQLTKPTSDKNTGALQYEQKFHTSWAKWRDRVLMYDRQGAKETTFRLTQVPGYFLDIVVSNLAALGFGTYTYDIDASLTEMKLVRFDSVNILSALTLIAETWETEWWITDNVIHLSRCEFGSPVEFKQGEAITDLRSSESKDKDYVTRLYAFGSTRNLPANYHTENAVAIDGVVQKRLHLPAGIDYVDAWPNMADDDVVEGVAILDKIYPRRTGTISAISTKQYTDTIENEDGTTTKKEWNAYRYKDSGLMFKEEYRIQGEEFRIVFQTGKMAGMDFAVIFNPDKKKETEPEAQIFEITRNDDYGVSLPSDEFHPEVADTYMLYGYDTKFVSETLLPDAEQELLAEAKKVVAKKSEDKSVYACPTNPIWCAGYREDVNLHLVHDQRNEVDLGIGQRVTLVSQIHFKNGYRESRIRAFEKRLGYKFQCEYSVGDASTYSRMEELNEKIDTLTYKAKDYSYGSGSVYVIKTHDSTVPSEYNVFSALRSLSMFLRKDKSDQTNYLVKFGDFIDSMIAGAGTGIFPNGRIQTDRLEVRSYLKVMELLYNRLSALEGDFVMTESGSVDNIEDLGENTFRLKIRKRWDNDFTALEVDDILRASINNLEKTGEYYTAFYRVLSKNSVDNTLTVVMYSDSECPTNHNYPPVKGMVMHRWGNTSDTKRQSCWYISSTEGRIVYLTGVTSPKLTQDMYASFYGLPVNLDIFANKPINYNEPYLYVRGLLAQDIIHVDHQGRLVYEIVDRGKWSEETASSNDPYLFESKRESTGMLETHDVWLNSCRYRCLKSGTRLQPKWNSPDWVEISGDPRLYMEFEQPNGSEFSDKIDCPIYVHIYKGVEEITDDVLDADIEWTRDTGRPDSDIAWASQHSSDKKFLYVADADCPEDVWLVKFTCKAFVRDNKGLIQEVKNSYIIE